MQGQLVLDGAQQPDPVLTSAASSAYGTAR
jgi:hypothetical protein